MATEIKAIQCPKCGSTQKTEVRPGVFRCDSCGTEYFLDNDDININVRQVPATPAPTPAPGQGGALSGLRWLGLLGLLVAVVYGYLKSRGQGNQATSTATAVAPERWQWDSPQTALFSRGTSQQPVLLVAGKREKEDAQPTAGVDSVGFYNAATGARLKLVGLPGSDPAGGLTLRQFSNGTVFLLLGSTAVYRVNAQSLAVEDVSKTLFQDQPALASGVASIGTGNNEDDSFYLFTNDGHHYNFYPLIHQLYTNDEQGEAKFGFKSLRPGSTLQTGFAFSRASDTYPDDPIQLIAYQYRDNGGGPKASPTFRWDDDFGGSGIFTNADPHVKRLITPYWVQLDRLTSYRDFTPGRQYFNPNLLYYDADLMLISVQPTAADNSPLNLQALDTHTGAIRFTIPLPGGLGRNPNVVRYPAGLVISSGLTTYTLSASGQLGPPVSIL